MASFQTALPDFAIPDRPFIGVDWVVRDGTRLVDSEIVGFGSKFVNTLAGRGAGYHVGGIP